MSKICSTFASLKTNNTVKQLNTQNNMADTMLHLFTAFFSKEELKSVCSYAFATEPTGNVSQRYVQANTEMVIDDLAKINWFPVAAKQVKNRGGSTASFHMVAFQNPDLKVDFGGDVCFPRIILTNSHDGKNSFKFVVGLLRLACSNGLVIADEEYGKVAIKHINYSFEELQTTVISMISELPNKIKMITDMQNTILSEEEKKEIAIDFLKAKKNYKECDGVQDVEKATQVKEFEVSDETINSLLQPARESDAKNDLWSIYNVLQENIIKGKYYEFNPEKESFRKQRGIKNAKRDVALNIKMFRIARRHVRVAA